MDFKIGKKSDDHQEDSGGSSDKKRQTVLLAVLLVLAGAFGYLYFFTGLINPENEKKAAVPPPPPQVIKQPLPPREGDAAKPVQPAPATVDGNAAAKPAGSSTPPATPPAAKTEPPKPVQPAAAVPPATAAKPKPEAKKPEAVKPAVTAKEQKPLPQAKAQTAAKPAAEKTVAKKVDAPKQTGKWTLLAGSYVLENVLSADMAKVKAAGLQPAIKPGGRKKSTMNRLVLGDYSDKAAARAELDKLKRYTSDAFVIEQGGKHTVLAGSYLLDSRAASEKERLAAAGYKLTIRRVAVSIPAKKLTAGTFTDKKAADAALKKLRNAGLKASLVRH